MGGDHQHAAGDVQSFQRLPCTRGPGQIPLRERRPRSGQDQESRQSGKWESHLGSDGQERTESVLLAGNLLGEVVLDADLLNDMQLGFKVINMMLLIGEDFDQEFSGAVVVC